MVKFIAHVLCLGVLPGEAGNVQILNAGLDFCVDFLGGVGKYLKGCGKDVHIVIVAFRNHFRDFARAVEEELHGVVFLGVKIVFVEHNGFLRNTAFTGGEVDTLIASFKSVEEQVVLYTVQLPAIGGGVQVNRRDTDGGASGILHILFDNTIANPVNPGADDMGERGICSFSITRNDRTQPRASIGIVAIVPPDFLGIFLCGVHLIVNGSPVFQFLHSGVAFLNGGFLLCC